ncbi:hypothetical protein EUGRSUZ_C00961, partial [Eucalyptus grandis]
RALSLSLSPRLSIVLTTVSPSLSLSISSPGNHSHGPSGSVHGAPPIPFPPLPPPPPPQPRVRLPVAAAHPPLLEAAVRRRPEGPQGRRPLLRELAARRRDEQRRELGPGPAAVPAARRRLHEQRPLRVGLGDRRELLVGVRPGRGDRRRRERRLGVRHRRDAALQSALLQGPRVRVSSAAPGPAMISPSPPLDSLISSSSRVRSRDASEVFDENSFDGWVDLAEAPALPSSFSLYKELQQLGFTIFLLTGRSEHQRNVTETNLLYAGYSDWKRLILRNATDQGKPATVYKSEKRSELESQGYTIHGSSGDQWSDLLGFAIAKRSFKLPNPMYYIS